MDKKLIISGIFIVFIILSGLWLSRAGKPNNVLILAIHKLISLGVIVYLATTIYQFHRVTPLSPIEMAISAVTFLLIIVLFITGGLLSTANTCPAVVRKTHQIAPYMLLLSTAVNMYIIQIPK
jgi:hypothetical protein